MELVIVAILLAFDINLIASQFLSLPIATSIVTTLLGVVKIQLKGVTGHVYMEVFT
jgi:hypothetical protein